LHCSSATPATRDGAARGLITFMGRFVTGPYGADARQFHVKSATAGRLHSRGKARKKEPERITQRAGPRPFAEKKRV